jgi:hypothetical protein
MRRLLLITVLAIRIAHRNVNRAKRSIVLAKKATVHKEEAVNTVSVQLLLTNTGRFCLDLISQ